LELLPGPRDREGLPDSIRFWKTRIEETDPDQTFSVGLIYGPSGCGKSSLVKAGLLPRLSEQVVAVYVEATANETETRLLHGLRKRCPALPDNVSLKETLAALRRGQGLPAGKKLLIVLDQFEQWLHAQREEQNSELIQALRQCDGGRVQCVAMVRDDFWLAATRFMAELEIDLLQGHNTALADLFDRDHAQKVLAAFGRAFGRLPENAGATSNEQKQFLHQAVSGLAQENKVICVRLALFADMMKGRPWTPAALKEVGGTEGVGITFLEETFSAQTANPKHRLHQKAARAVLKVLLPDSGTDLKGHMRSDAELLAASGYGSRRKDFDNLIHVLDGELRLITPTDPEGKEAADDSSAQAQPGQKYYQLTHDYLVPSLRDWLTRKQKETRRGRAELLLADRAAVWNARPENRQLPSVWQWLQIRCLTRKKNWTPPQRKMMRRAGQYFVLRVFLIFAALSFTTAVLGDWAHWVNGNVYVTMLKSRDTSQILGLLREIWSREQRRAFPFPTRWLITSQLRKSYEESEPGSKHRLHISMALLPVDPGQLDYVYERLLVAEPQEMIVFREALRPHADALSERLWGVLRDTKGNPAQRLRVACVLADYAAEDVRWEQVSGDVARRLVAENVFVIGQWANALRPVRKHLMPPLAGLLVEEGRSAVERRTITVLYADYAKDVPDAFTPLEKVLAEEAGVGAGQDAKLALARRQANAAVALATVGRWEKGRPLLRHSPDPTLRSYLIDRLGPGGVEARELTRLLDGQRDDSIRRAMILALGEYDKDRMPLGEREALVPQLLGLYWDDPDPGLHGAVGWLLRQWGQEAKVCGIDCELATGKIEGSRQWYVNGQGQTLVVVPPGEFETQEGRERFRVRVDRGYALAAREITVADFRHFRPGHQSDKRYSPFEDCPVNYVSWYDAAEYCNWLSEREGIAEDQWCYLPNASGKYAEGMKLVSGWQGLSGYRLPTQAEWEYACRAGCVTNWSLGEAEDLLGKYAWCVTNASSHSHPVGSLRPNDLGLFDLHGNANEWCQNRPGSLRQRDGRKSEASETDLDEIVNNGVRVMRGGSYIDSPVFLRVFVPGTNAASSRNFGQGFRPARTIR
jgi:formylglycine-generating enzyme required for sulfatase activity